MKFDFCDRRSRNQTCHSSEILTFLAVFFFCLVHISMLLSLLEMVCSNFKIVKEA